MAKQRLLDRRFVLKVAGGLVIGTGLTRLGVGTARADGSLTNVNSGYSGSPSDLLVWRVVRDTALPVGEGESLERALGFLLANRAPLHIEGGGGAVFVAEGETYFVPEADIQRQESATGEAVEYVRFGLVDPSEATYTAGGELLLGSEFQQIAAGGSLNLNLYEGRLSGAERVALPATVANGKVVYADRGPIAIVGATESGDLTSHRYDLEPGEAWIPTVASDPPHHWEVIVAGEASVATFFVATAEHLGSGEGEQPGEPEDGASSYGTITVMTYGCPQDATPMDPSVCGPWAGKLSVELESFESGALFTLADGTALADGSYQFEIPYGRYMVRPDVFSGPTSISARINGSPVQNPTAAIDASEPYAFVEFFFRY